MSHARGFEPPPFCPNERCAFHSGPITSWRWVRNGCFRRLGSPHRVQRFRCDHCGRHFSEQTFRTSYWLKRPALLEPLFHDLNGGSCFRQIARKHAASPQTVALQCARLGRQAQLFHELLRPKDEILEPLDLDSFQSFEFSQYHPLLFHILVGQHSHFFHGFTVSELRRSGRMTPRQKRRRAELERRFGRPDPRSIEREVARVLGIVAPRAQALDLYSDEHPDYPRAIRRVPHLEVTHRTISSRAARTSRNPLFAINLVDLLARHSGANHKRETIAFSKRAQSAIGRCWLFLVWRDYVKWFSERRPGETPAMRVGACAHRQGVKQFLARRLFPGRIPLPPAWREHYWGRVPTRRIPNARRHQLKYAC